MDKNNFQQIAKDIVTSYESRIKIIKTIVDDTRKLLEEFGKKREKMGKELKETLAKYESLRKKDFDKMMEDILIAQSKREENVKKTLSDFQEEETEVVENLGEMFDRGEGLRAKDLKKALNKIKKDGAVCQNEISNQIQIKEEFNQMKSEVREMLERFKKEREETALEWKNVTALMAQKKEKRTNKINLIK